jgi:hypothetical protein
LGRDEVDFLVFSSPNPLPLGFLARKWAPFRGLNRRRVNKQSNLAAVFSLARGNVLTTAKTGNAEKVSKLFFWKRALKPSNQLHF